MASPQQMEASKADVEGVSGPVDRDAIGIPRGKSFLMLDDELMLVFGLGRSARAVKRGFDVAFSLIALIVLLPLLVVVGLAVLLSSRGPAIYAGVRVGEGGRRFKVLKFRSMRQDAEAWLMNDADLLARYRANGFKLSPAIDPRITRLGRFLRRSSLDELPQLWNILMGHMSVVGPRPVVPEELHEYGVLTPIYLVARPGLTGHWQVFGRGVVEFPERAYLDLRNVHDWTLRGDIGLILKTIPVVLSQRGAQ